MLFKKEMLPKIAADVKTQTRRPVRDNAFEVVEDGQIRKVMLGAQMRVKWEVGRDYGCQPGRGMHTVKWWPSTKAVAIREFYPAASLINAVPLRIRITRIRKEDAREISGADVLAEGFTSVWEFLRTWIEFYDDYAVRSIENADGVRVTPGAAVEKIGFLKTRPDYLYQCWVLDFEVCKDNA